MSTFENEYLSMNLHRVEMPAWVKTERYEYCEPEVGENASAKKNFLARFLLSAVALAR